MPEILIQFNPRQLADLQARLAGIKDGVPKALAGAINDTAKQGKTQMSSRIREKINLKKKDLDPLISISPHASPNSLKSGVHLSKTKRPGLEDFGGRQTAQGVTYQIEKAGSRKLIAGAFRGPRPGVLAPRLHGGVFRRVGKSRKPIVKLRGISPFAAFLKSGMLPPTIQETQKLLDKNVEQRTRFLVLKANGAI